MRRVCSLLGAHSDRVHNTTTRITPNSLVDSAFIPHFIHALFTSCSRSVFGDLAGTHIRHCTMTYQGPYNGFESPTFSFSLRYLVTCLIVNFVPNSYCFDPHLSACCWIIPFSQS